MTIANIHEWLAAGQDYNLGIKLLEHFTPEDTFLLQLVQRKSSFAEKKMLEALEAIARNNPIEEPEPDTVTESDPTQKKVNHTLGKTDGYPEHLKEIDRKALIKMKERDIARGPLFTAPEGQPLYKIALDIVKKDQEVTSYIDQLNYYCRTGQLLPGTEPITELRKFAQMMLALKNHPPYISKHRKSTVPAIIEEVERRKAQLREVDNFLKANL